MKIIAGIKPEEIMQKIEALMHSLRRLLTYGVDSLIGTPSPGYAGGTEMMLIQLREMFIMFICGACTAFMFRVYNGYVRKTAAAGIILAVCDIVFCVLAGITVIQFWYRSSFVRISLHETAAMLAGLAAGLHIFNFENNGGNSKRIHTAAFIYGILLVLVVFILK